MAPPDTSPSTRERLRIDDLSRHLLLKNGNYLYKVPFRGGFAVLKVYQGSRTWMEYALKTVGNVVVCNQTSFMPRARRLTELSVLKLWRDAGFRVFGLYDDVSVEGIAPDLQAMFEYVPRRKLVDLLNDATLPLEQRLSLWRGFMPIWHRRHRLALERSEPRLVHENGDLKHVMPLHEGDVDGRIQEGPGRGAVRDYLQFDFEMVFRSRRRVPEFVSREILQFLKSLGKTVGEADFPAFMAETVRSYPGRDLLERTHAFAFENPDPIQRLARAIDRRVKPRAQKTFSKYNVARRLQAALAQG